VKVEEVVKTVGYSWNHDAISTPEDDEKNTRSLIILDSQMKSSIHTSCAQQRKSQERLISHF
jgi:hypothetical protein